MAEDFESPEQAVEYLLRPRKRSEKRRRTHAEHIDDALAFVARCTAVGAHTVRPRSFWLAVERELQQHKRAAEAAAESVSHGIRRARAEAEGSSPLSERRSSSRSGGAG